MKTIAGILLFTALALSSDFTSADPAAEGDFHHVDELGGYHFGYNDGRLARQEERSPEGIVRGAYTYVDANGQIQIVTYTADKHNGFLVSGTNIPKVGRIPEVGEVGEVVEKTPAAVMDTPEVLAARAEHLEAVRRAKLGELHSGPVPITGELLQPVMYTPEVAAARAAHFNAYNLEAHRNRPVVYVSQPAVHYVAPAAQYHPDYLPYVGL